MNVNNDLQAMQQLFSSQEVTAPANVKPQSGAGRGGAERADEATLSPAASLAAQAAPDSDVRMDKVAAVQQALAAGTYNVPSGEVAGKMIDRMLGN
ncbi:MAG TPA: flagellar biosynthesis anti-sigma factor FlgM [Acidobacteriaceae bacterium]